MKYEMIFGDERLFDGAPDDCILVVMVPDEDKIFYLENNKSELRGSVSVMDDGVVELAMRRIIPEPKRWTVEDQKAGRLPAVGGECRHCRSKLVKSVIAVTATHIAINENNSVGVAPWFLLHEEFMQYYIPIETPEEKAARLRSEWINKAYVDFHRFGCEIEVLQKEQLKQVYDALLSGELPMPSKKGGE